MTTIATSFIEAIKKRAKDNNINEIITTAYNYEHLKRPYIVIPEFEFRENWLTTKSRIEGLQFSFVIHTETLEELEDLQMNIMSAFDYCEIITSDKRFMVMEWVGINHTEVEPGFWQGTVEYEILQEKDIE